KKKNDNITNTVDSSATSPLSLRDVFNSKSSTQKSMVNQDIFRDQVESNMTIHNSPVQQLSSKIVKKYPELLLSDKSQSQSTMKTRSVLSKSTTNVPLPSSTLEAIKQQEITSVKRRRLKEIELNNLLAK
ncbi:16862_t:CDS:2, partial [Funneliformis caledonium]